MTQVQLDLASLLVSADASLTLSEVEDALAGDGLTLGIADFESHRETRVGLWLAQGGPGSADPWLDPADHLLAGLDARLPDGTLLSIRPAPRRSTGPDLVALAFGMRGRFVAVERAWLRVHPLTTGGVRRPETEPFHADRDPPVSPDEEALFSAIGEELGRLGRERP